MAKTIILIPGLGGSKIYCNCKNLPKFYESLGSQFTSQHIEEDGNKKEPRYERLYPSKFLKFTNMNRHFFSCKRTKTKPLLSHFYVSVYKRLVERLRDNNANVKIFSYDWRLNPLDNCHRLKEYLEQIIHERKLKETTMKFNSVEDVIAPNLILVGHSLGGLMLRILMEYLKYPCENIFKVYICGTPLIGSLNIYDYNCKQNIIRILSNDKTIVKTDIPRPLLISSGDVVRFIQTFPQTTLFLMPTYEVLNIKYLPNVLYNDIYIIRTIHRVLGRFNFPGDMLYTMIFNISQKNKINYKIPEDRIHEYTWLITRKDKMKLFWNLNEGKYHLKCNRQMDSAVVPCTFLPSNCSIIFDSNYLKHNMIMNSQYISSNIIENN